MQLPIPLFWCKHASKALGGGGEGGEIPPIKNCGFRRLSVSHYTLKLKQSTLWTALWQSVLICVKLAGLVPGNGWKDTPQAKQPIPYIWHVVIPNNTTSVCQRFQALFRQLCPSTSIKPSPRDNASTSTGLHTRCHTTESPGLDTEMGVCVNLLTSNNLPKSGVHDSLFLQHGQGNTDNQPKLQRCADGAAAASWSVTCQTGPTRVRRWGGGGRREGRVCQGRETAPLPVWGLPKTQLENVSCRDGDWGYERSSGYPPPQLSPSEKRLRSRPGRRRWHRCKPSPSPQRARTAEVN